MQANLSVSEEARSGEADLAASSLWGPAAPRGRRRHAETRKRSPQGNIGAQCECMEETEIVLAEPRSTESARRRRTAVRTRLGLRGGQRKPEAAPRWLISGHVREARNFTVLRA